MSIFSQAIQASLPTNPNSLVEGVVTNSLSSGMKYGSDPAILVKNNVINVAQINSMTADKAGPNFDRFSILSRPDLFGVTGNFFESAEDLIPISTVTATLGSNFLTDELSQVNPALLIKTPGKEIMKLANNVYKSVSNEAQQAGKAAARGVVQTAKDFARGAVNTFISGAGAANQNVGVVDSRISYAFFGPRDVNDKYVKGQKDKNSDAQKMIGVEPIMNPNYVFRLHSIAEGSGGSDALDQSKSLLDKEMSQGVSTLGNREVTLTNLLKLGDFSKTNVTPYRAADFLWLKHYNRIPLNRLVTLRRYLFPIDDANQRSAYFLKSEKFRGWSNNPVAQMVTYFGGESGNNLSSILSIQASTEWDSDSSELNYVDLFNGQPKDVISVLKQYFESSPIGKTVGTLASSVLPNKLKDISETANVLGAASLMAMGIIDTERYSNLASFQDRYNPYQRGGYLSDLYQQPFNVVKNTKKRRPGLSGGLNSFTLDFEYSLKSIGHINAKAAMLDIMANVLATTHYRGNFWGGEARFFLNKGIFPLLDQKQTINLVSAVWRGDYKAGTDIMIDMFKTAFGSAVNSVEDVVKIINAMRSASEEKNRTNNNALNDIIVGAAGSATKQSENDAASKASALNSLSSIVQNDVLAKFFGIDSSGGASLPSFQALKTGAPVGEWHVTVGNPLKPIAKIGNLICNRVTIKFNDELGSDDFPTEMKVTVSLEPGMPRANQDIESIFNHAGGSLYLPKQREGAPVDEQIETISREAALSQVADFIGLLPNSVAEQVAPRVEGNQLVYGLNPDIDRSDAPRYNLTKDNGGPPP